ncbi:outer membrane beta-barrel protein [Pontiellaceae bacterium B12219]|nr:outer membrane beta-barrel protein [Pontiellaceae bacterium B12219]
MKKSIILTGIAIFIGGVSAEGVNPYYTINAGAMIVEDAAIANSGGSELGVETGYSFGIATGISLQDTPVRVEAEYFFSENDIDEVKVSGGSMELDGDATMHTGMLNCYYDFTNDESPLIVSVFGGVGFANIEADVGLGYDDDTVFAFQVGLGIGYPLNDNLVLETKYAYFTTDDPEFELLETEIDAHRVTLGLRYNF